jgi:hypothetical protein
MCPAVALTRVAQAYESDLRDASEFLRWQTEAKKADEVERKVRRARAGGAPRCRVRV